MDAEEAREHFENFTHSISAARKLLARAQESGSLIEGLVLYAALVDGLLRMLVAHSTGDREGDVTHLDLRNCPRCQAMAQRAGGVSGST